MVQIDASLAVDLGGKLDAVGRGLRGVERAMSRPPAQPFTFRQNASDSVNAGGSDLVLDLGAPNDGRFWYVMGITTGGLTYATTAAGTALVVVSASRPLNAAQLGTAFVYDQAASLPLPSGYSRGQIVVHPNESLYVIIVGGTASQAYVAAATIEQYEDGARAQTVSA